MTNRVKTEDEHLAEELALLQATELVVLAMERAGIGRSELAAKLEVNPSEITQRLSGTRNLTVRTLANMLYHLDHKLVLESECTKPEEHDRSVRFMLETHFRPSQRVAYRLVDTYGQRAS